MKTNRLIAFLLVILVIMPSIVVTAAQDNIKIMVNGKELVMDQSARIIDGRVMVPARAILEELGFTIIYDQTEPELFKAYRNNATSDMYMEIALNGLETKSHHIFVEYDEYDGMEGLKAVGNRQFITFGVICDVEPMIINGRTLLPARAVSEASGAEVKWDINTQTVYIDTANPKFYATYPTEGYFYPTRYHGYYSEAATAPATNQNQETQDLTITIHTAQNEPVTIDKDNNTPTIITPNTVVIPDQPPVVGSTPAKIATNQETITDRDTLLSNLLGDYIYDSIGQCTWYVGGRFHEIYGISLIGIGLDAAKYWLDNADKVDFLYGTRDLNDIEAFSIAVFMHRSDSSHPGHVAFIEYVERDSNGTPIYVYYTDANRKSDGEYHYGIDATVKKVSINEFMTKGNLDLVGYIKAK